MKTRAMKAADLEVLRDEFGQSATAFVVEFQGLKVVDVDDLRKKVREAGGKYRVVKNTLARKASQGTRLAVIETKFKGPTAVIHAGPEPAKVAKVVSDFAKANPAVVMKAGAMEGLALDAEQCKALANLPTREELLSKLLFLLKSPMQRLATVLAAPQRNLAVVINQVAEKKSN